MADHPNKHIREAIRGAEQLGWRVSTSQGHIWGVLWCPEQSRDGCRIRVFFNSSQSGKSRETHPSPSGRVSAPVTITTVKKGSEMKIHEFTLILSVEEVTDGQCSTLYEAGCDDGTISTSQRVTRIDFCRDAPTLEEAIRSAIGNVNAAGLQVARVEIEADTIAPQRR